MNNSISAFNSGQFLGLDKENDWNTRPLNTHVVQVAYK